MLVKSSLFVCLFEGLRPSQSIKVMSSAVSLPNHTFTGHDQEPHDLPLSGTFTQLYVLLPIKWTLTNIVDPDQTLQNAASNQGLHSLHKDRNCYKTW